MNQARTEFFWGGGLLGFFKIEDNFPSGGICHPIWLGVHFHNFLLRQIQFFWEKFDIFALSDQTIIFNDPKNPDIFLKSVCHLICMS